jgi:hypothetical protein
MADLRPGDRRLLKAQPYHKGASTAVWVHPKYGEIPNLAKWGNVTLLARMCNMARKGYSKADVSRRAGLHADTIFAWLKDGREDKHPLLTRFALLYERAAAHYNAHMVDMVTQAATSGAPNTWQAAMTLLERRDPANWGRRDTTKIEHEGAPLVQLNQVVLVDDETRELSRSLLRRVAGPRADIPLGPGVRRELEAGDGEPE